MQKLFNVVPTFELIKNKTHVKATLPLRVNLNGNPPQLFRRFSVDVGASPSNELCLPKVVLSNIGAHLLGQTDWPD